MNADDADKEFKSAFLRVHLRPIESKRYNLAGSG
jgi:hypothetical protein